jgi:2-haloalkanoic acid dehalogenase type II
VQGLAAAPRDREGRVSAPSSAPEDAPALLTFDVFGTVVDWRRGVADALAPAGIALDDALFDRIVDAQGALEARAPSRRYREIVAESLRTVCGLDAARADAAGAAVGAWPAYPDSAPALRRLLARARCVALTNSDRDHGEEVQARLGLRLSAWLCAEEVRCYKPDPRFWREAAARLGVAPGPRWWHVSAYADYDLGVARALGLTPVFVARPHARPGTATHAVADLAALAELVDRP